MSPPSFLSESYTPDLQLALTFVVTWIIVKVLTRRRTPYPLPPGPPRDPIIGGERHMPTSDQWITFTEWKQKYGNIIYTHVFGSHVVVLNSFQVAKELLETRGANYSSRPRLVMAREILGWNNALTLMPDGERLRRQRNWATTYFNPRKCLEYRQHQLHAILMLLNDLLHAPDDFLNHVERSVASSILMIAYGIEVQKKNDPYVKVVQGGIRAFLENGSHGAMLVDLFPIPRTNCHLFKKSLQGRTVKNAKPAYKRQVKKTNLTSTTTCQCHNALNHRIFGLPISLSSSPELMAPVSQRAGRTRHFSVE